MIKVLHISTAKSFRGAEHIIANLCNTITTKYDNYLFCPTNADLVKKVNSKKVFTYNKLMGYDLLAGKKLNSIIKKEKINLLHIHDSHGLNLLQIINFLGNKTKAIVHRHVDFKINHPKKYQQKNIVAIIVVNKNSYEKLKHINKNIFLIYNGIDVVSITNQTKIKNSFVFVGNLSEEKNPLAFIEILNRLHEQNNLVQAHIFGDGSLKSDVVSAIQNRPFIKYHGFVEHIVEAIQEYEFLISTSSKEGFPLNILEAMSQKLLVVAPNINGINDILNSENAILYNDRNEVINQIASIMNNENQKEKIIKNAFQTVQEFSTTNMIQQIHNLYNSYI
ncbi:MAG: glycosyltransferase family 4 protein [Chitinophagales bacterium]|nr:glycosyltransferase family 4 protein [Chitinophagales bacterium]